MSSPKHPISVYTVMLIVSAIFMFLACIFMLIEYNRYEGAPPRAFLEHSREFRNLS